MKFKLTRTSTEICYVEVDDNADEDELFDRAWDLAEDMRWRTTDNHYNDTEVVNDETWAKAHGGEG